MRYPLATSGRWVGLAVLMLALTAPALAQRTVTLRLNTATLPDTTLPSIFNSTPSDIQVRGNVGDGGDGADTLPDGNVIDWNDGTTLRPTNDGGDYWSIDFQIPDNEQLDFKFYSTQAAAAGLEGWEAGGNHAVAAGTGDVALDLHYFEFSDQEYDWRPFSAEGDSVAVWLRVYMNTVNAAEKGYEADDTDLQVGARGNFGTRGAVDADGPVVDWGEGGDSDVGVRLSRESTDATKPGYHLFSGLVKYPASAAGESAGYKFFFVDSNNTGDGGYEGGSDRSFTIPAAGRDTTIHWVYYSGSVPLEGTLVTSNVTFQVDVSPLTSIGLFQTGEDFVQVRGGFNGFNCDASQPQDDCLLSQIPGTARYAREIPIQSLAGSTQDYKYYIDFQPPFTDGAGNTLDIGWEEPLDYGGGDRPFMFEGAAEQDNGIQFFNNIRPDNVIGADQSIDVTFTVDMNEAATFETDTFDPSTDSVSVRFEDNVWLLTQGYEPGSEDLIDVGDGQAIPGFKLTDPDGDLVYTGVLTVAGPTYNGIAYNYFYSSSERSGIIVEGRGGFDEGRRRYRYITDRTASAFSFAADAFKRPGTDGEFTPWEVNPTGPFTPADFDNAIANGATDVFVANEQGPGIARGVTLSTPRPNPTSGGMVRFALGLENAQEVRAQVIDLTGRTVATLANGYQAAGETELSFNTTGLAAGMYIVRVEAAGQVVSRRMTVVR